jgi:hypothetical protein
MTTPPDSHRVLKFVSTWTLANAIAVGSIAWFAVLLINHKNMPVGLPLVTIFIGFGIVALVQQFVLLQYGLSVRWWWLTSYLGCGAATFASMNAADEVDELIRFCIPHSAYRFVIEHCFLAMVSGLFYGGVQIIASQPLRQRLWVWPIGSALACSTMVLIGRCWRLPVKSIDAYLLPLVLGAAYGIVTGLILAPIIKRLGKEEPTS